MATDVFGQPNLELIQELGFPNIDDVAVDITVDSNGNIYVTGASYSDSFQFTQALTPYNDAWVAKYDRFGNQQWLKQVTRETLSEQLAPLEVLDDITVDGFGNIYLKADALGDENWVVKYDSAGTLQWRQQVQNENFDSIAGKKTYFYDIASDNIGNFYLLGRTNNVSSSLPYDDYAWIAKYDSNGNQQYIKQLITTGLLNSDKEEIIQSTDASSMVADIAGNVYVTGSTVSLNDSIANYSYNWIAKYDSSGNQQYLKHVNAARGQSMAVDSTGNIFIAGFFSNGDYASVTQYDESGNELLFRELFVGQNSEINEIVVDNSGNVYVTQNGEVNLGSDYDVNLAYNSLVTKYDSSGIKQWVKSFTGFSDLAFSSTGEVYVVNDDGVFGGFVARVNISPTEGGSGTSDNDTLSGSDSNNIFIGYGYEGNDSLSGANGNDVLFGNQDADTLDGGIGDDSLSAGKDDDLLGDAIGNNYLNGNMGNDTVNGGAGNDTLYGGKDNDILNGGNGNDRLSGDFGNDTLTGGAGSDRFVLTPTKGPDLITDFTDGIDRLELTDGLTSELLTITPGTDATLIYFSTTGELLASLSGVSSDLIGENDILVEDNSLDATDYAHDTRLFKLNDDELFFFGTPDTDTLSGSNSNDIFIAYEGNDSLNGANGNDVLFGNQGADTLDGGMGDDSLSAGKDNDLLNDAIGNNYLNGNMGNDTVNGGEGNETLHGGKDNDILNAGNGDDRLSGDFGNDTLTGGAGSDRFVLTPTKGPDLITDFADGSDRFELTDGLTFEQLAITSGSNATLINLTSTGELLASLSGVPSNLIGVEDFIGI